ncbi:toxin-antitoxin system, toxin component [Streptomyces sp. NPDC058289]|uniref:toxin-antitoxin system, toxin component n=1 Tax=Streptomyces sp. NPDC058289 TaxID=3346425 RepID=UPI0036E88E88
MNDGQTADLGRKVLGTIGGLASCRGLLSAPRAHLARRSNARKIARFCESVLAGLDRPIPADPDSLFEVLRADVERRFNEDRTELPFLPVLLYFRTFPPATASGLTARFDDRIAIIVESQTTTLHQFVIFAHEMWHVLMGECLSHGAHSAGASAAARSLGGELAGDDLVALAARSHVDTQEESDAEEFGLQMGARLRDCLKGCGAVPTTGLAARIQSSIGRGRGY